MRITSGSSFGTVLAPQFELLPLISKGQAHVVPAIVLPRKNDQRLRRRSIVQSWQYQLLSRVQHVQRERGGDWYENLLDIVGLAAKKLPLGQENAAIGQLFRVRSAGLARRCA